MVGSEEHLRAMSMNLLSNAVKYSYRGDDEKKRWIGASVEEVGSWVHIKVENYGIGISPEERQRIFERFTRGARAVNERKTGSGLGLYTVNNVVKAHGGTITVTSVPQGGGLFGPHLVAFSIRLPKTASFYRTREHAA